MRQPRTQTGIHDLSFTLFLHAHRQQVGRVLLLLGGAVGAMGSPAQAEEPYKIAWTRQLGTAAADYGYCVSADDLGNVFVAGETGGGLGGDHTGDADAFVSRYDCAGNRLWTRQIGTTAEDYAWGVAADGLGNVVVSGYTKGGLEGGSGAGSYDAFVSKYDTDGTPLWTRQLGTAAWDYSSGVACDAAGNVFISGFTQGGLDGDNIGLMDAFLSKYDRDGEPLWTQQIGTDLGDYGWGIATDGLGNVYISGETEGDIGAANAGNYDAFVSKYDADGTPLWSRQIGTEEWDYSCGVTTDGWGNVFISGFTYGDLAGDNAGQRDAFVTKYDSVGALQWTRQLGTDGWERSYGVSADGLGNVYISGRTNGILGTETWGDYDAFVSKYDGQGTLLWTEQIGTTGRDESWGVTADSCGNVYITGYTNGSLAGSNAGGYDAFITKLVPEPAMVGLLALGTTLLLWRRKG